MTRIRNLCAAGLLAASLALPGYAAANSQGTFADVTPAYWGAETIAWGVERGLVSGYPDGTFKPEQPVKESEFLAMLLRYFRYGEQPAAVGNSGGQWWDAYYQMARELNWPATSSQANQPIKRGQVARLIAASQGFHYDTNNAVQYLYDTGVSKGRDGSARLSGFGKEQRLTRTEAVQFIKNLADRGLAAAKPRPATPSTPLVSPQGGLYPIRVDWYWGYMDGTGRIWVDPQYSDARPFREGMAAVFFNGKWGFLGSDGEVAVPLQFDWVNDFHEGLAAARVGYRYGYIDKSGKWVIPPTYSTEGIPFPSDRVNMSNGLASVKQKDKHVFVNREGKVVTPAFDEVRPFREGRAAVRVGGRWGYIDTAGRWVVKPEYDRANDFHEGLAAVAKGGKYGYIHLAGNLVIPLSYSLSDLPSFSGGAVPHDFHDGLAIVAVGGKYGYIDKSGQLVIPPSIDFRNPTHDDVTDFSDGMAMVRIGYRFGFIDRSGKMAVPPLYDDAKPFSEGLAPVRLKGKYGYVDKTGRMVIEPQFAYAEPFQNGLARVEDESNRIYYIDQTGKKVTE